MKISCPACSAKYSIADDKVQDRLAKIRCRKCGATIVIDGKSMPPNVYTAAGEAADSADQSEGSGTEYSVDFGEGDQRTMSAREIVAAYNSGRITGETYVWADGFSDWKPLSDVPELVGALNAATNVAAPSPWDAKPAPSVPRTAARTAVRSTAGRSATADLFGGIDTAGSEDEVATSAPDQAAPGRGRSLLGSSPTASAGASSGGRNESSVLFSLSALTSAAQNTRPSTRPAAPTASTNDDSGLIDLKALTAAAMKSDVGSGTSGGAVQAMPALGAMPPLGVTSPLGLGSPLGNPSAASTDYGPGQQKGKAPLFIGGGLAVGMIAIAAAIALRPAPLPPPPPAPAVVAAPPPAPTVAPAPEVVAKPPSTATGEEEAAPSGSAKPANRTTRAVRRPSGTAATKKPTSGSGDAPAAAPKAAPPPSRSKCGCSPSDLTCNMRCAAKGG